MATIPSVLRTAADHFGKALAAVDDVRQLSFVQLAHEAETAARGLIAEGVAPGDRVAIWAPNRVDWIVAAFGVYLSGAILVPLNTRLRRDEAHHILTTAEVKSLFTVNDFAEADFVAMLEQMGDLDMGRVVLLSGPPAPGLLTRDRFESGAASVGRSVVAEREEDLRDDSAADIIFTSGTTGLPKGAVLTHGASVRTYEVWSELVGLREGDRYLCIYPFSHTAGLKSGILACLIRGATIYPHAVFDVPTVMEKVASHRITMLPGPPTVFQSILSHPHFSTFDLSSLRLSVTGAAVVPESVVRAMRDELNIETVVTGYGMTETTGTISMCRYDDPPMVIAETVGRPLPGVEVQVVDDKGAAVADGSPGEFWIRGFNLMKGYFRDPVATADAITPDGWLKTGDIGLIDSSGNLRITDRKKDMFIVGGFNVYPAEVEACLLEHPGIAQVAVVGVPDDRLGETGTAFVVPKHGVDLEPDELIAWTRHRLSNFKVPRHAIIVRDGLPLTASGKVLKHILRQEWIDRI